jgi:lipopolysaccharide/colanic/teichoic acid biosynthesis glycosyltransferase
MIGVIRADQQSNPPGPLAPEDLVTLPFVGQCWLWQQIEGLRALGATSIWLIAGSEPEHLRLALRGRDCPDVHIRYVARCGITRLIARAVVSDDVVFIDGRLRAAPRDLKRVSTLIECVDVAVLRAGGHIAALGIRRGAPLATSDADSVAAMVRHASDQGRAMEVLSSMTPLSVRTIKDHYRHTQRWSRVAALPAGWTEPRPGLRLGPGARVHPSALRRARGPIWIGPDARVGRDVELEGPVVIGARTRLGARVRCAASWVGPDTVVESAVSIEGTWVRRDVVWSARHEFWLRLADSDLVGRRPSGFGRDTMTRIAVRGFDVVAAATGLVVVAPVLLALGIAIRVSSAGPALYRASRVAAPSPKGDHANGYDATSAIDVPFPVLRTMTSDANRQIHLLERQNLYSSGPYRKAEGDPRVTRLGKILRKTSLDALPLLWSVLMGHLRLVGLWALPRYEAEALAADGAGFQGELHQMARVRFHGRPGIAGLWQSLGRSALTAEERAVHDAYQAVVFDHPAGATLLDGPYRRYRTFTGYLRLVWRTATGALASNGV